MPLHHLMKQNTEEIEMLGEFKELFCYQVIETDRMIVVNMKFYDEKIASVIHLKKRSAVA